MQHIEDSDSQEQAESTAVVPNLEEKSVSPTRKNQTTKKKRRVSAQSTHESSTRKNK